MKTQITRINKMFFTSMLILSLGYTATTLTFTTDVEVDNLTIAASDKIVLNTGVTMTVNGAVSITGTLQMDGDALLDAGGAVTVEAAGTLDMNGTSRLKMEGHLEFNNGTLQAEAGTGIDLDGGSSQNITGIIVGSFESITRSGNSTVFGITATIEDSLDTGGQNFTISAGKTLTMDAGSVVEVSGGIWTRTGTLLLNATSKVLYTTGTNITMQPEQYGNLEHDGGVLSQEAGGGLDVAGTFTNTSGNFAASENITAKGVVWTLGSVTGSPNDTWNIGTDGITINGGTFVATTGTFTLAGNWTNGGTATLTGSTVNFDGATAQTITSDGSAFSGVTISNTAAIVSLVDAFASSGTFTINLNATFATAGQNFTGGVTIANSGTFQMNGNEVTTVGLVIDGMTKFVAPAGATLSPTLGSLVNVTFDANAQTIVFGESIDYISGDITVAVGTTVNMSTFNLTVAANKEIENNGTWSEPSAESTLICAGSATFSGIANMNFYNFSAQVASSTLTFQGDKTYKVLKNLTIVGTDGNEIYLTSHDQTATATISNATAWNSGVQNVDYCRMEEVDGDGGNPAIDATNSWDVTGTLNHWNFGPMTYTYTTTGNWDVAGNWFEGILPAVTDNVIVPNLVVLTLNDDRTINEVTIAAGGEIIVGDDDFTINGACDIDGTITVNEGAVDANNAFDAENGIIDINNVAGDLKLSGVVAHLGALSFDFGTVTYDGPGDQGILADAYYSLTAGGGAGTKTLAGAVTCADAFTTDLGVTVDMNSNTLAVTGATDIDGILTVGGSTLTLTGASVVSGTINVIAGTVDADGTFNAAGGNLTFTGAGSLNLSGNVTSLGTLTALTHGTVTYDGGSQNLFGPQTYVNLVAGGTGTKTLLGDVTVSGAFTSDADVTTAMGAFDLDVAGATDINGIVTIVDGTLDADGTFDAAGAGNATGGIITFTGAGHLELEGNVTSLGALTATTHGTVTYNGPGDQNIVTDAYVNLIVGGGGGTKTLLGAVTVSGAFTIESGVTTAMGINNLTVVGATTITGIVTITTGTLDANTGFNASGGTIDINDEGNLLLGGTTPLLGGNLSTDHGTVTYNGTAQTIFADTYFNLTAANGNTKTLGGALVIENDLTINGSVTLDVSGSDYAINVKQHFANSGTFTMQEGLVTFDGDDDQALTTGGSSFFGITFNTTGGSAKRLTLIDALTMTNNLTITAGTIDLNGQTVNLAGNVSIANNAVWVKGGLVTFNGGATQSFADGNTIPNNLGHITID